MIPSAFVLIDAIPLTPNGKIDRQALLALAPRSAEARTTREIVGPRTDTEIALAAIWRELLQVQDIGVDDDFFDLGGQSLMAIGPSRASGHFDVCRCATCWSSRRPPDSLKSSTAWPGIQNRRALDGGDREDTLVTVAGSRSPQP